jgi:hypothetical protein
MFCVVLRREEEGRDELDGWISSELDGDWGRRPGYASACLSRRILQDALSNGNGMNWSTSIASPVNYFSSSASLPSLFLDGSGVISDNSDIIASQRTTACLERVPGQGCIWMGPPFFVRMSVRTSLKGKARGAVDGAG